MLGWLDWALIVGLSGVMFVLCGLRSREHLLWVDELVSYQAMRGHDLDRTLRIWWNGGDSGQPLFYVLGWVWVSAFGLNALSLRMFSTAGMAVALGLIWAAARRFFGLLPVAWALTMVFLLPSAVRWQEINGRFYGLFLASAAFASLCFLLTMDEAASRKLLWLTAGAHACLIASHILGVLYSCSLIVGMVALDAARHRFRPRLYGSALAGWVMILIEWHSEWATAVTARGDRFWTVPPHPFDLLLGWGLYNVPFTYILFGLGLLTLVWYRVRARDTGAGDRRAVLFLCLSLLLAQLVLYAKSQAGVSIYSDRYLLPLAIGTALILAAAFEMLMPKPLLEARTGWRVMLVMLVILPCAGFALRHHDLQEIYPKPGVVAEIATRIPPGVPVLVTQEPPFLLMTTYDPGHRYFYLLDWAYDLRPGHTPKDLSTQGVMENWTRAGVFRDRVLPCHAILTQLPELDVLLDPGREDWFAARLANNPGYTVEKVATFRDWEPLVLWHVRRIAPGPAPC